MVGADDEAPTKPPSANTIERELKTCSTKHRSSAWRRAEAIVDVYPVLEVTALSGGGEVVVMSDHTLLGGDEPARFADGTPYPAPLARNLAFGDRTSDCTSDSATARSIRRLFTDPAGRLITAETNSRNFTRAQREFIQLRDGLCTTPWCDAPIVDIDHHDPHVRGGPTSCDNALGTCRWCNVTKADDLPAPDAPPAPRPCRVRPRRSRLERRVRRHIRAASRRPAILIDLPTHRCTEQRQHRGVVTASPFMAARTAQPNADAVVQ